MEMKITFKIGDIEINTTGTAPNQAHIPDAGRRNMAVLNAISKIKIETGIDLIELDEDINQKAIVEPIEETQT
ncbi:hypothetical protein P8825_14895 [Shouchella clausii]|uniref:hypothetical protein n=1 Tax=Shouchella clausii TaxID=79880 RepID=UPI002DB9753E|nr:hypothetical protein [Shouchella clausii]MEB5480851.1 hypothetical protein [Shouchella clausii]